MHTHDLSLWTHSHDYGTDRERRAEQRTRWVVGLTLAAMVVELIAGWLTGSMALLADGWHMGSHAAALGVAAFAYQFARRHRADPRFTFGTGKIGSLAGYSSALLLGAGALWMLVESLRRLIDPVAISYADAMLVACLGLAVNLLSAWLLHDPDGHDHGHGVGHSHGHEHHHHDEHGVGHAHDHASAGPDHQHVRQHAGQHAGQDADEHQDHNLRAAYLHVIADALTSVLALLALGLGMTLGWAFMDPLMGIVGATLIGYWAVGLARGSARVLLDVNDHEALAARVREHIEEDADNQVADLHLWRIGPAGYACIVAVVTHEPRPLAHYRQLLASIRGLVHVTIEVHHCQQAACGADGQSLAPTA